jgi:predicted AlkP superfamily phosphohydrolase/phosphomutase
MRIGRGLVGIALAAVAVGAVAAEDGGGGAAAPPRLIVLSWDGAGDWIVDRLLEEGALPNLAALARRGVAAAFSVPSYPSKTAASHAALWTGCWGDVNGITGNNPIYPPATGHSLLETRSGYSSEALSAEPFWVTAAKKGRRVVVLSATQSYPPGPLVAALDRAGVPADRYLSFSGFENVIALGRMVGAEEKAAAEEGAPAEEPAAVKTPAGEAAAGAAPKASAPKAPAEETPHLAPPASPWPGEPAHAGSVLEIEFTVADTPFFGLAYDDPADPAAGYDTLLLRQGSRDGAKAAAAATLKPRGANLDAAGWSPPFRVTRADLAGNTFFRLFALAPDGSSLALYQRQASALRGAASPEDIAAYEAAYRGFHDNPFELYDHGGFGPPLMAGGDGTAEARALEVAAFDVQLEIAGTRFAWRRWQPDLMVHYSPLTDGAGHSWIGVIDPDSRGYDPALAQRLWPLYSEVFRLVDRWLGEVVALAGDDAAVAVVSDHGMAGVVRRFRVNRALADAGLLAAGADGRIDLARTRVLAPKASNYWVKVNSTAWRGGIVAPADRDAAVAAAAEALLSAVDPETGRHPVPRVFRPEDYPGLGIGGPVGGDLYFDLAPGYYPDDGLAGPVVVANRYPWPTGEHGYYPEWRKMHAIFYAAGPGLAAGVTLPPIRHVDVAPTLMRLLGLPPPPQSCGRVVAEALAGQ